VGCGTRKAGSGVEVGWKLGRHAWGQGYATEAGTAAIVWAFDHLGVDQLISVINPEDTASLRVAERLGMTKSSDAELDGQP
jgi:RimJ/RimL family protein N-acetyltransferase